MDTASAKLNNRREGQMMIENAMNTDALKERAARPPERNQRRIERPDASEKREASRTVRRRRTMSVRGSIPPDGEWRAVGDIRDVEAWLNSGVAIVRRARGEFAVVGHYRQSHVEIGPFPRMVEARRAWNHARVELEAFRQSRIESRRRGIAWPPRGAGGAGWTSQEGYTARCAGCARRAAQRAARSSNGSDCGTETARARPNVD